METNWRIYAKKADFNALAAKYNIDPVVARVIRNRDITTDQEIEMYLYGGLNMAHEPLLMKDMDAGTDIMIRKISEHKKIRIISDYDVDGVMSNYVLLKGLGDAGADVSFEIPDRMKDGYGINERIIKKAVEDGIDTIITCDNGIAAVSAIALAKESGLTVIVTDHHEEQKERVTADAVIDIKQSDCTYPYKEICGTTVAYKFIKCLYQKLDLPLTQNAFLEFVAIATVCDVMALTDENRIYVREGLKKLRATDNVGLRALLRAAGLDDGRALNSFHLGFVIGPCINATGRLESAERGLRLLCSDNMEEAEKLAEELISLNETRKGMTVQGVEEAVRIIEEQGMEQYHVLIVYVPGLHESLAGIVAGRLREKYYKPVIILTDSEADSRMLKGSGRSIEGYHMFEAIQECSSCLEKFGGHELAAGLSLRKERYTEFLTAMNEKETMTEEVLTPKLFIDVPMPASYVYFQLVEQLNALAPFGKGNEKPVFAEAGLRAAAARILGKNRNVLKLTLEDKEGRRFDGIYFEPEEFINNIKEWFTEQECDKMLNGSACNIYLDIAYQPDINEYMGRKSIQLKIINYRKSAKE